MKLRINIKETDGKWTPHTDEIECIAVVRFDEERLFDHMERKRVDVIAFVEIWEHSGENEISDWRLPENIIESVEELEGGNDKLSWLDKPLRLNLRELLGDKFILKNIKYERKQKQAPEQVL